MKMNAHKNPSAQILLVEDNRDDEELMLLTLAETHITNAIMVVRDGAEALDYLFETGPYTGQALTLPHLILLDVKLPKINGMEVLERIKTHDRTRRIPVVMLTSSQETLDVNRSYELGVNSYIVKPVDFDQFKETIRYLGYYWQNLNIAPADHQ